MGRRLCGALLVAGATVGAGATGASAGTLPPSAPQPADTLVLPAPVTALPTFPGIGLRPDRRLVSHVPGVVRTHEDVAIGMGPGGAPASVVLDERLHLSGTGAYLIYERGPARVASPIGDSLPPVLELGTVVWQGFSPGGRDLAARLRLDPVLEAERLPVIVTLSWQPASGGPLRALGAGGQVPGPGVVTVHVANTTGQPQVLPTATVAPAQLVSPLTTLLAAAQRSARIPRTSVVLPTAGQGLPRQLPATDVAQTVADTNAPMRLVGTITATDPGARLRGPTVRRVSGGGRVSGVLSGSVDFTLTVPAASRVTIDLVANPSLDTRSLAPPAGSRTWATWARTSPSSAAAHDATDQLVAGAAAAARGAEISPYIGSDTTGPATTTFRYTIAPPTAAVAPARTLHPHPLAIGLAAFAGLTVAGSAAALWRRS